MKNSVEHKLTNKSLKCNAGQNEHEIPETEKVNRDKAFLDFIL